MRTVYTKLVSGSSGDQAGNLTGSAVRTSQPIFLARTSGYAVQGSFSSKTSTGNNALTGTVKLQASCQPVEYGGLVTNWTDVSGSATTLQVSGSSTFLLNVIDVNYAWARVHYTGTSGSGSLDVDACVKNLI